LVLLWQPSEASKAHIQTGKQPVTQITVVESEPGKQAEALSVMTERARFMARQPGFVSISVHRSLDGRRIVNYIQWQSRDHLQAAHKSRNSARSGVTSSKSQTRSIRIFTRSLTSQMAAARAELEVPAAPYGSASGAGRIRIGRDARRGRTSGPFPATRQRA